MRKGSQIKGNTIMGQCSQQFKKSNVFPSEQSKQDPNITSVCFGTKGKKEHKKGLSRKKKQKKTKSSLHTFFLFNFLNILQGKGVIGSELGMLVIYDPSDPRSLYQSQQSTWLPNTLSLFAGPMQGCEVRHPNSPSGTIATSLPWSELPSVDRDPDMQISTQKPAFCQFLSSNFLPLPSSGEEIHH